MHPELEAAVASRALSSDEATNDLDTGLLWLPVTDEVDFVGPVMAAGDGNYIVDVDGRRYLSASSALWNVSCGYGQTKIVDAIIEQAKLLPYATLYRYRHAPALSLATELIRIAPSPLEHVFFTCSGGTAVETAVKAARKVWAMRGQEERNLVVAMTGSYHGLTTGSMQVSSSALDQAGYGIDASLTRFVTYPSHANLAAAFAETEALVTREGDRIAAIIFEPVQGTDCVPMDCAFAERLQELADEVGFFLIDDEVTTGFGRTGTMLACEWLGIEPHIMTLSKGINSGYLPIGATLFASEIREVFRAADELFLNGETQGGNPIACAASLATIQVLEDENLVAKAAVRGEQLAEHLGALEGRGLVKEVRGRGLMLGLELELNGERLTAQMQWQLVRNALDRGVLVHPIASGIGVMPPLTITEDECDLIADVLERVLVP